MTRRTLASVGILLTLLVTSVLIGVDATSASARSAQTARLGARVGIIPSVGLPLRTPTLIVPPKPTPTLPPLLIVGDSISCGYFSTEMTRNYARIVAAQLNANWVPGWCTVGISAQTVAGDLQSGVSVLPSAPRVVVELGTNDSENGAEFAAAYSAILGNVRYTSPGAKLVCLGVWLPPGTNDSVEHDAIIQSDCADRGGTFVDLMPLFANTNYRGPVGTSTWLGPSDDFHPNDAGHAAIASAVLAALR